MKITIKRTGLRVTAEIENQIQEKIGTLDKFLDKIIEAFVEVSIATQHHRKGEIFRVEVDLRVPGAVIRSEATRKNLSLALTEVKDELQRQIKKYKGERESRRERGGRIFKKIKSLTPLAFKGQKGRRGREREEGI